MATTRQVGLRAGEAVVGLALAALGIGVLALAARMPLGSAAMPGPGVLPLALGVLLAAVGAAIAASAWRRGRRDAGQAPTVAIGHGDVAVGIASLVLAAVFFEPAGAPLVLALLLAVLARTLARASWWRACAGGICGAGATWYIFKILLGVPLPAGLAG